MNEYIYFRRSLIIDELNQFVTLSIQTHRLGEKKIGGIMVAVLIQGL